MHSRASQALAQAFRTRGAQQRLAKRTGISQPRLSRLAQGGSTPTNENSQKLKDDPEIPIDPAWWGEPPLTQEQQAPNSGSAPTGGEAA